MSNKVPRCNDSALAKRVIAVLLSALLFTSFGAAAQAVTTPMVIETTEATHLLASLEGTPRDFGRALINFVTHGSYAPGSTDNVSMLSAISRIICVIALFVMAWLAVLGGSNFIIQTANKGVPGGQVISSFWMPLRISVATILLIPLTSGYSTLQLGVNKIGLTGNDHGSYLTRVGINHLVNYGAYVPPLMASNKQLVDGLVAAELCLLHKNAVQNAEVITRTTKTITDRFIYSYDYFDSTSRRRSAPISNYCGMVQIVVPDAAITGEALSYGALGSGILARQNESSDIASRLLVPELMNIIETIQPLAAEIAASIAADTQALSNLQGGTGTEEQFTAAKNAALQNIEPSANQLVGLYNTTDVAIQNAIARVVNTARSAVASGSDRPVWADEISELGWTALGTIYWQQNNEQKLINNIARTLQPTYVDAQNDGHFENDERFGDLILRYHDMLSLTNELRSERVDGSSFGPIISITEAGSSGSGWFKSWVASLSQSIMYGLTVNDDGDFINRLQATGNNLVTFIDLSYHASILVPAMAAGADTTVQHMADKMGDAASGIPIIGKVINALTSPASGVAKGMSRFTYEAIRGYSGLLSQLLGPLVIAGFVLAVVLPSIPLFFWLLGVVSWILFYIECLLVSPIWLSAHGTAEKEGWGSEHTRQGYMLMLGLYLNPILRTAGYFAILVVIYPLGVLVGWMSSYLQGVMASGMLTSPFIVIGGMLILAFLGYSIAMRVFSLPNELFERGLRWVNGGQEVTGDENSTARVNTMIASFGHKTEHTIGRGMRSEPTIKASPLTKT